MLIVHPSGGYNRHAPWSIPKGIPDDGETDLEATARRETFEETGVSAGPLTAFGFIDYQKSRKRVHLFRRPRAGRRRPAHRPPGRWTRRGSSGWRKRTTSSTPTSACSSTGWRRT